MGSVKIPESLREEHDELFRTLNRYAKLGDSTGRSVSALLNSLEPHLEKENELVMPLLGLISKAATGHNLEDPRLNALYQRLRIAYRDMVAEHSDIRKRIEDTRRAAETERHRGVSETMDAIEHHVGVEEEVLYPAALLVGATLAAEARIAGMNVQVSKKHRRIAPSATPSSCSVSRVIAQDNMECSP